MIKFYEWCSLEIKRFLAISGITIIGISDVAKNLVHAPIIMKDSTVIVLFCALQIHIFLQNLQASLKMYWDMLPKLKTKMENCFIKNETEDEIRFSWN